MRPYVTILCGAALAAVMAGAAAARDFEMGGDSAYPYSIMAPEPGKVTHRARTPHHLGSVRSQPASSTAAPERYMKRPRYMARGSSGSVLPAPLPRTQLIPPEGGGAPILPATPQQQGPTFVPGLGAVPNLPHGPETFQDRASRCALQQGLYGVPNGAGSVYMHSCAL